MRVSFRTLRKPHRTPPFDFQCVGVQKGGTTWLSQNCAQHPEIRVPLVKEVQYFSHKHLQTYYPGLARKHADLASRRAARLREQGRQKLAERYQAIADGCERPTEEWYRQVFSVFPPKFKTGEFTPDYFCLGPEGVRDLKQMNRSGCIIIFVRDPRSRIISSLNMSLRKNPDIQQSAVVGKPLFLERGNYLKHIPIWDDTFGDQVLYIPFRDIAKRPEDTMRSVEKHIGVGEYKNYKMIDKKYNSWSGKFNLDFTVMDWLENHIEEQEKFLEKRFGRVFCSRI
ncbi:hypothetical protein HMH01_17275 [Halovulum dunhuangense]|uniref:Sulfotransferase family protein n=1 Tax=Halovulum dunhuangense TaxID=1505036 RepID=A0A849L7W2_9RHOB|nr:sulfotransferase [Halovulum dunhuangense]NNU82192.1 hypothetical protein [Halovulum dunhuangense]